jgi:predicted  nucleic acid-binding Zn-ribbon protein
MADTSNDKKTDVLNLRLDPALAAEIQRIADWRGTSASEIARDSCATA